MKKFNMIPTDAELEALQRDLRSVSYTHLTLPTKA